MARTSSHSRRSHSTAWRIGIGIDTARYGHHVTVLDDHKEPLGKPVEMTESRAGYRKLETRLRQLHTQHPDAELFLRIDAAGQYATNLETFLRSLDLPLSISVGEPKRNKDYHRAHSPKNKTDASESRAMARYAVVEQPEASPQRPPECIVLRRVAGRYMAQVKQSTRLTNQLHETMSAAFPELAVIVKDFSKGWLLALLKKYPTAQRITAAKRASVEKISHLTSERAAKIHVAARDSVASLCGAFAEELVRQQVDELQHSLQQEKRLKTLLIKAFEELPDGPHRQLTSIKGIGHLTAAAIVATAVDINRFETANNLVGYYGVFPEEFQSGVDKQGRPIPPGKKRMCPRGNDLVRALLWNCAKCASQANGRNPAVRALYLRRRKKGDSEMTAWGYCMTKLLRQVWGVWMSGKPFDPQHERAVLPAPTNSEADSDPGETDPATTDRQTARPAATVLEKREQETAGHKENCSNGKEVTAAPVPLEPVPSETQDRELSSTRQSGTLVETPPATKTVRNGTGVRIDFRKLCERITFPDMLRELDHEVPPDGGAQRRCPCPFHEPSHDRKRPRARQDRTLSIHLERGLFQCFHSSCGCQGNVLDFWAAWHGMDIRSAALHMAATFRIPITELS